MRSFLTYGAISLVGIAALYACGDDSGDGTTSTAGTGGQGGTAGGAGAGGSSGNTSMSGAGGGAGAAGSGAGGAPTIPASNCTGCVQLSVVVPATPVDTANARSQAGYSFTAVAPAAPFDLTNVTTITWRVQALTTGASFYVQPVLQNGPPEDAAYAFGSYPAQVFLTPAAFASGMFVDVPMAITALAGGSGGGDAGADAGDAGDAGGGSAALTAFDKSKVRSIALNVGALAAAGASVVSIELDSVTVAGTSNFTSKTFTTGVDGLGLNMYQVPPGTLPPAFH